MTTELFYLFLCAVLLTVLWIPYIVGQAVSNGPLSFEEYKTLRDPDKGPDWMRRANRAHLNLVEQFGAFAGLVVVGHLAGVSTTLTVAAATAFFWLRLAHAVVQISGIGHFRLRTLIFTLAFACLLVLAWEIATKANWA